MSPNLRSLLGIWTILLSFLGLGLGSPPGISALEFIKVPPGQVDFSNNTGARIECRAGGAATVTWVAPDLTPVSNITGLRRVYPDGTLVFSPFASEAFRQDVHAVSYRCQASSTAGTIVTADVKVRAVMDVDYDFGVYDVFAIRGNTAIIKCHVPGFLQELVSVVAYIRDDNMKIDTPILSDGKFSLSPSGSLYVKDVGPSDAGTSYRCQILPRLNGQMKTSSTAGRLFVNAPQGNVPPKIVEPMRGLENLKVEAQEGNPAILPCIAQGYPTPVIQWYLRSVVGDLPLGSNGVMKRVANGLVFPKVQLSDSGIYICRANNTIGSDQIQMTLSVTAPLKVEVKPQVEVVDLGRNLELECVVTGFPIKSMWWLKNGHPVVESQRVIFESKEKLRIESVSLEDKGMYQCFVQNDKETVHGSSQVRLGDFPPVLQEVFSVKPMHPGRQVTLSCVAAGSPQPEINWFLDTMPLEPSLNLKIATNIDKDGRVVSTLNLESTSTEDGGVYTCKATNVHGKAQASNRLNIYGPLAARRVPTTAVVAGEDTHLFCPVSGYPIQSVKWEKDSKVLPLSLRQVVFANGTLLIKKVQRKTDGGDYVCTANDGSGKTAEAQLSVRVLVAPKLVPFVFQDDLLREGMRARVQCTVSEGDSPLKLKWMINGQSMQDAQLGVTIQEVDEFSSILTIGSVTPRHNGDYSCSASNAAGTAIHTARLFVNGNSSLTGVLCLAVLPKVIPFAFQDDQNFKGMRAHISCAVSQGDLPLTFQWFKDGQSLSSMKFAGANVVSYDGHSSSLSIDSVTSGHSGNYTCITTNEAGTASYTARLMVQGNCLVIDEISVLGHSVVP